MVAWHEVPGKGGDDIRPVGYGVMRLLVTLKTEGSLSNSVASTASSLSYRTLRDGSHIAAFPGTSCQATIIGPFGTIGRFRAR